MKKHFILITLALFSIGLVLIVKSERRTLQNAREAEKNPQEYMSHLFATIFNDDGNPKNQLSADYWAYQPEIAGSTLIKPHLIVYKPDGTRFTIDAKQGFAKQPRIGTVEQLNLHHQVVIKKLPVTTANAITIETEALLYQPNQELSLIHI